MSWNGTKRTPRGGAARRSRMAMAAAGLASLNVAMMVSGQPAPPLAKGGLESDAPLWETKPADTGGVTSLLSTSNDPFYADESAMALMSQVDAGPKRTLEPIALTPGSFETVENGHRRVHRTGTRTLSADEFADLIAAGKTDGLNGRERMLHTFTDYLPEDWMQAALAAPAGARVDSYGNPIINEPFALPGWAQRDVDALRDELANWLLHMHNLDLALSGQADQIVEIPPLATFETYHRDGENLLNDRVETQHLLGNYLGQAIVRRIDVSDTLPLNDSRVNGDVVNSIAQYLHFYEGQKASETQRTNAEFVRGSYPAEVINLLAVHGHSINDVLTLEAGEGDEGGVAGGTGCYNILPQTVGMTATVGATVIWSGAAGTFDDVQADIPIGWRYYFNPCENPDDNFNVRVSSNGYISFFEQGGGATDGTAWDNDPLPSAADPDGFAAPWWDDLTVTNQGTTDVVRYKRDGAVGFRVLTIEYLSVSHHAGALNESYSFQVRLWENYPVVEFHYSTSFTPDSAVDSRSMGLESFDGSFAYCAGSCTWLITGAPTANYKYEYPQASNDGCLNPICLEEDQVAIGSNFGAGGSDLTSCSSGDYADVFYTYRAPISDIVTVTLCSGGNGFDTTLGVFGAGCSGSEVACDDDGCVDLRSHVNFMATAGATYMLRVSGYLNARGTFAISVNIGAQGDTCINPHPINIPGSGPNYYSTFDNSGCNDESSCGSSDTIDEWLIWTAPASGTMRASTCAGQTSFDTTLAVFTGSCGSLTQRACNDDAAPSCFGELTSRVLWNVDAGTTYLLRVAGYSGASGEYDFTLNYHNCPADIAPLDDGDGVVDVDDLVTVILTWGACDSCRADFTPPGGNGQVDVDDLVSVILAWGPCPGS